MLIQVRDQEEISNGFGDLGAYYNPYQLMAVKLAQKEASGQKLTEAEKAQRKSAILAFNMGAGVKEKSGIKKIVSKAVDPLGLTKKTTFKKAVKVAKKAVDPLSLMQKAPVRRAVSRMMDPLGLTKRGGIIGKVVDPLGIKKKISGEKNTGMKMARYPMVGMSPIAKRRGKGKPVMAKNFPTLVNSESKPTIEDQVVSSLAPVVYTEPSNTYFQPTDNYFDTVETTEDQKIVESMFDGPLVIVYSKDGTVGQIPSNYIVNGEYVEDGVVWSVEPKEEVFTEGELVTVYAEDGTEGQLPSNYIVDGKYEEDGIVWSVSPFSLRFFWRKIVESLRAGDSNLQGLGEEYTSFLTDSKSGSTGTNWLSSIKETADSVKSVTDTAKAYGSAYRGIKRSLSKQPTVSYPASVAPATRQKVNKILGLPPAVALGGAAVGVTGLTILLIRSLKNNKE